MKKIYLFVMALALLLGVCSGLSAQTVLISPTGDGGFETGTTFANNGWTAVNATGNQYYLGSAPTQYAGSRCAFTSNSSTSWTSENSAAYRHIYRDVTFPTGITEATLSFYYKLSALDSTNDGFRIYMADTSYTPVTTNYPTGTQIGLTWYDDYTTWTQQTINLDPATYSGTTRRLIFTWRNDNNRPRGLGALDNISLTYFIPAYAYTITPTHITVALNAGDSASYTVTVTNAGTQPLQITGLSDTADWLTYNVSLPQTVTTGNSFSFPVTVNATGLYQGLWSAYLTVTTDSSPTPTRQVEFDLSVSTAGVSLPINPRMVAEWELARGVGITWDNYSNSFWPDYKFGIPDALIQALSQQLPLFVGCPAGQQTACANYLTNIGINNYNFITANTDTYWVRDYGPWAIYEGDARGNRTLNLVDFRYNRLRPDDDQVGDILAEYFSRYKYDLPMIHTGGNIMTDGNGTAMSTNLVLNDNDGTPTVSGVTPAYNYTQAQIQGLFEDYLGVTDYHIYQDPLVDINDTVDHMDLWCKLLDVDIVLIKRVAPSNQNYDEIETATDLWNRTTSYGGPFNYRVFRVDCPNISTGAGGEAPYCNSIIVNKTIYVPQMGGTYAAADAAALQVYRQAMPAYTVVGFTGKSSDPWLSTDAIHCRVNTIWDPEMIHVWHVPLYGEVQVGQDVPIHVTITSFHPLADSTYVTYRFWDASEGVYTDWVTLPLANTGGNDWSAVIPGANIAEGDSVFYAIRATDSTGRVHNERLNGRYDPFVLTARRIDTLIVRAVDLEGNALPGYDIYRDSVDTGEVTYHTFTDVPGQLAGSYSLSAPPAGYEWLVTPQSVSASDFTQANNYTVTLTFTLVPEDYLPVELSSFTVTPSVNNQALLTWVTQTETNMAGFAIHRGICDELDKAIQLNVFIAATNTSQQQTYVYLDEELVNDGIYYYWLESRDLDGTNNFYGPVTITLDLNGQYTPPVELVTGIDAVYPNPFNPDATIAYSLKTQCEVEILVYNARGQLIRHLSRETKVPGIYSALWNGRDDNGAQCTSGIYNFVLRAGKERFNRKAVLLK